MAERDRGGALTPLHAAELVNRLEAALLEEPGHRAPATGAADLTGGVPGVPEPPD